MELFVRKFAVVSETPKLEYVEPLFKRRLSQISKMTIHALHEVLDCGGDSKLVFISFRGEIGRQLKINRGLVEDGDVMPASFSISVFNTPPAVATIALGMKAGYTAIYPAGGSFSDGLSAALAPLLSGKEKKIILAYGDEKVPEEYESIESAGELIFKGPLAFACVISSEVDEKTADGISIRLDNSDFSGPEEFIKYLCSNSPENTDSGI